VITMQARRRAALLGAIALAIAGLTGAALSTARTVDAPAAKHTFSYSGDAGPAFWSGLAPDWADCSSNHRQSPINISAATVNRALKPLVLSLRPSRVRLVNDGHTVKLQYDHGSFIRWQGRSYTLLQLHFHTPSEHTVNGRRYSMELHAVFQNPNTHKLVVIGQLYRLGHINRFLDRFDRHLPQKSGDTTTLHRMVNAANAFVNTRAYWTYAGSLTTPPCSPTVTFIVLKRPATMSPRQLHGEFWRVMGDNFRPQQARNGRVIESTR
jgi:carbonic anhydrase